MKLLFCPHCKDIVRLYFEERSCKCGKSAGYYLTDGIRANYIGEAIPLGLLNTDFMKAVKRRPKTGKGKHFTAFVIPENSENVFYSED